MKTVLGLYEDMAAASQIVAALVDHGIPRDNISLATNPQVAYQIEQVVSGSTKYNPNIDAEHSKASHAKSGAAIGGVSGLLIGLGAIALPGLGAVLGGLIGAGVGVLASKGKEEGVTEEEAGYYAEAVRRGSILISTKVDDDKTSDAIAVMKQHQPINVHDRAQQWRNEGWSGYTPTPSDLTQASTSAYGAANRELATSQPVETTTTFVDSKNDVPDSLMEHDLPGEIKIPVIEEELKVGKRQVKGGSVHVNTRVEMQPVEQQVQLHEENVTVERWPVDRSANPNDLNAFEEGDFEVKAISEEVVVEKRPHVVEEVIVKKQVKDRTETVSDTVRKTKVDVKPTDEKPN